MKALLYFNFTSNALKSGSSNWTPPLLTFGEQMTIGLRFQQLINGTTSEIGVDVRYLKAAIGSLDSRPERETFAIKVGDRPESAANVTRALPWNAGAQSVAAAINELPTIVALYGRTDVMQVEGSLILKFGSGSQDVPLEIVQNRLIPASYGLVTAWQKAGEWFQELRLIQAPVAFCDSSERVLPPAPTVTEVRKGGNDGVVYFWNEIQQMEMPPEFRGTFQYLWKNVRSALLSRDDGPDELTAALAVFGNKITATNPRTAISRFEFSGDFKGSEQPLLQVVVVDAPEGDLTFTLDLGTPMMAALLRSVEQVTLPLEIEVGVGDTSNPTGVRKEKIRTEVTIRRGMIFDMLATAANIDWLRPLPVDYVPFTRDQILVGQLFWAGPIGDGSATVIHVPHNLDTEAIAGVLLRENIADGRVLTLGTDYTISTYGRNTLRVTILGNAPAEDGLALVITAAGMRAVFQAHNHTIDQIELLRDWMEASETRLSRLESYIPSNPPTVSDTSTPATTITVLAKKEVLFHSGDYPTDLSALSSNAPYLLPAVHTANIGTLSLAPSALPAKAANTVWAAAAARLIPGGGKVPSSTVPAGGFVASDGRMLYPASNAAGTVSYFPTPFERTLWEFAVAAKMLPVTRHLELSFALQLRLLNATSEGQWVLVIEQGTIVDQTDPANEAVNLQDIAWAAMPILSQRLIVASNPVLHTFGCRITNATTGITADRMLYGSWEAATGVAPASAVFALRARLINFDTKNNVPTARGWLNYLCGDVNDVTADFKATIFHT